MMLEIEPAGDEVPPPPSPPRASNGATKQNLSFAAIMIIACNTMNGPGLTTLPNVAHSGGQLAFVVLVYLAVATTVFCVKRLCLLMWQQNPEHHHAGPVLEETDLVALSAAAWQPKQVDPQYATLPVQEESLNEGHDAVQSIQIEPTILQPPPLQQSKARRMASLAMVGCALALALAQMMLCAKIADSMIVASFGKNCGLGWDASFHCTSNLSMQPFAAAPVRTDSEVDPTAESINDDTAIIHTSAEDVNTTNQILSTPSSPPPTCLLTVGLLIASSITVSLASVDQSSMLTAQYILFACLLLACLQFCRTMSTNTAECRADAEDDDFEAPSLWGASPFDAVGPVLFNFAFVVTVPPLASAAPSGLNSAVQPLGAATLLMGALYCIVGWMGAPAVACLSKSEGSTDDNLLSLVLQGTPSFWDVLSVIVFGLSQLAAIPVYCCMGQEVMEGHIRLFSSKINFILCHVAPWVLCVITYNSALFEAFVEWSSLILLGFSNFSLPLLLEMRLHPEQKHDGVLWVFCLVSSSIAAVIVQQLLGSLFITQIAFLAVMITSYNYRY